MNPPLDNPSALRAPEAGYVRALENLFIEIRGRGVQWSADDRERALRWNDLGVSLPRVVTVVEARAKAWRFVHGDASSLPIHLRYYERAVIGRDGRAVGRYQATAPTKDFESHGVASEAAERDAPLSFADSLYELLNRVPDLVSNTDDPALQKAYKKAGLTIGRSLKGETADCASGIDLVGFEATLKRARAAVRKTVLAGIGPAARHALLGPVEQKIATEGGSAKAQKRRLEALTDAALQREWCVLLPTPYGWQGASPA